MLSWPVFIGVEVLKERNFSVSTVFQHFADWKFYLFVSIIAVYLHRIADAREHPQS